MLRAALLALPLALWVGCGDDGSPAAGGQPAATRQDAPPTPAGTKVVLRGSDYGKMLFNAERQAIYLFDKENSAKARCYGDCATAWPPVYAGGEPRLGKGLKDNLLGTTKRRNGKRQITYGGHPLYYYAHEGPGEVLCHDIVEYGGTWLVVKRNGNPAPGVS
jgi:predicted lipoprotein with Yx(FWY)xxD motif